MKKVFLGMFVMLMSVFMFSCSKADPKAKLQTIVEQVKAEGANWDAAKWKSVVLEAIDAVKPIAEKMKALSEEAQSDPSKIAEIMKVGEENAEVEKLFSELMEEVGKSSVASELENDPDLKAATASMQ